jgi:hypothetical protein
VREWEEELIIDLLIQFCFNWRLRNMSAATDNLTAAVAALQTASGSAVTELGVLQSGPDEQAIATATTNIEAVTAALTTAVTPTAPTT